jgi:hypothetical protein
MAGTKWLVCWTDSFCHGHEGDDNELDLCLRVMMVQVLSFIST